MEEQIKDTQNQGAEKTFTQSELDQIIGERLRREREKYADYDELKGKAEKYDQSVAHRRNKKTNSKNNFYRVYPINKIIYITYCYIHICLIYILQLTFQVIFYHIHLHIF